jgi:hypothetical protein
MEILVIFWGLLSCWMLLWMREKFVPRKLFDDTVARLDKATEECRKQSSREAHELKFEMSKQNEVLGRLEERSKAIKETGDRTAEAVARVDGFLLTGRVA